MSRRRGGGRSAGWGTRPTGPANHRSRSRGMVTAELAVGLMTVALVLFGASSVIGMLILQDRAETVAVQAARHAGRGDTEEVDRVRARAPRGSTVDITRQDGWVTARVRVSRSWGRLGPVTVEASASQPLEPGR